MSKTATLTAIMIASTILCASCKGPLIKNQVNADINFKFNRCRVRCYSFTNVGTVQDYNCNLWPKEIPENYPDFYNFEVYKDPESGKSYDYLKFYSGDYPLISCDKLTGFYIENYAKEIRPEAIRLKEYYEDRK